MGGYTNYEIVFEKKVEYNNNDVENMTRDFDCKILYLRDNETTTLMCCLYSQTNITTILDILSNLYSTNMKYRVYNTMDSETFYT